MTAAPTSLSIVHRRVEPEGSLDYFPTPPWAGRALVEQVIGPHFGGLKGLRHLTVEEPACGEGHLAYALSDYFGTVTCSDIHDHGFKLDVPFVLRDFLGDDVPAETPDWIITNPPFGDLTLAFMRRAIARRPRVGIAFFLRTTALDGKGRYRFVYSRTRPVINAQFVERVPVHKGRWVPDGDTHTAYCWLVWRFDRPVTRTDYTWIAPCRDRLLFQRDIDLFGVFDEAPAVVPSLGGFTLSLSRWG